MPSFQELFTESKGQPVEYNGQIINLGDRLPVSKSQTIKLTFVSVNSDWRQGVHLHTDGTFEANGQTIKKAILLWQDTAPRECIFTVHTKNGELLMWNVWDTGDGVTHSGHNGAAMIVEELPNGRLYKCNDGHPDDDFDDLVFSIELVS